MDPGARRERARERPEGTMSEKILIRGVPGSGKTTLVTRVVENLSRRGFKAAGFITEEIREGGSRRGFKVRDLRGEEAVLAHVELEEGPRVGKYRVDVGAFECVALRALHRGREEADFLVIDEIGKMETFSAPFRDAVRELMRSTAVVLATAPAKDEPFLLSLLGEGKATVFNIHAKNREEVREVVEERLEEAIAGR